MSLCLLENFIRCDVLSSYILVLLEEKNIRQHYVSLVYYCFSDLGWAHCCFGSLFEEAWARVLSWSLIVSTESSNDQSMEYSHSLQSPHVMYNWSTDVSVVERFSQGFRLCFHVDDWVMFEPDESGPHDSNVRLRLVARLQGDSSARTIIVEDLFPFNFPKRRSPSIRSVNAWNDGGSMEFVGLNRGSQQKMVIFSMHYMRLIASMQSISPFARLLPMPHLTGELFGNAQNDPAKLRLAVDSHKEPPSEIWIHLDFQDCHGVKVGQSQAVEPSLFCSMHFYSIVICSLQKYTSH